MNRIIFLGVLYCVRLATLAVGADQPPLLLVQEIPMPGIQKNFDHLTADAANDRLFVAAEWHGSVEVYQMSTGKLIHSIGGMNRPHAMLYRADINKLFVTDGTDYDGAVHIFDCKDYSHIKDIKLLPDTDSIAFDPKTKYLYVTDGGEDARLEYSFLNVINTDTGEKIAEIKVDSDTIGAVRLDSNSSKLYLDESDKGRHKKTIYVIDRDKREVIGDWPVVETTREGAMAIDEEHRRLFSGCIEGVIAVLDLDTGKELQTLAVGKGTDDIVYDPASKRLYVATEDKAIFVYHEDDPNHYALLGKVPCGPAARTGRLVPEMQLYFTAVPAHDGTPAILQKFKVQ